MLALKQPIEGHVSEIVNGCAVVRDENTTEIYNLAWYRLVRKYEPVINGGESDDSVDR